MEELFILAADGEPPPLDDPSGISFAETLINRHDTKSGLGVVALLKRFKLYRGGKTS